MKCSKTYPARQERAPTPKIAMRMILSLVGLLIWVRVLIGMTKIHMSSKMLMPAFTANKVRNWIHANVITSRIHTVIVHECIDTFLVSHSEDVPVGVDWKALENCNHLRSNP